MNLAHIEYMKSVRFPRLVANHFNTFELNFSNIIDYCYNDQSKIIINDSNIFIVSNTINEFPQSYYLDLDNISSYFINLEIL